MRRREQYAVRSGGHGRFSALLALTLLASAIVLGACGGDDAGGGGGAGDKAGAPTSLKVGVIPIADVAPLYLGIKKGFFKAEKLTIEPVLAEGGAAIVPAVLSGDDQIGFSNTTSLVIAKSKRLPIKIISQGDIGGKTAADAPDAVLVKKDSPIRSAKDLVGKTVSVNTLSNVGPLGINTGLDRLGVDYKKVKYVEVPFPDALVALKAGRVDAAWVVEPFVTAGTGTGARIVMNPFEEVAPNLTVATYFTTEKYISENKDVVDRFVRAINKSMSYAQGHPDEVRQIVTTYTKIPPKVAKVMKLPQWGPQLNEATIERTVTLAKKYGFAPSAPSLADLIHKG
jgi:NitT/TauT family transport system substrate-binding protein